MRNKTSLLLMLFLVITAPIFSLGQTPKRLPSMRRQAEIQQGWLKLRLEKILPELMRKHDVAMWLVICREYNEDPAYRSLTSPTVFAARRRTILVFTDQGEKGIERLALGGGSNGGLYQVYRDPDVENRELWGESQWATLRKLIAQRDPKNIAVNISATHAFSDGLSAAEYEKLQQALGAEYSKRLIRAENLPLEYISVRVPEMLPTYKQMMEIVHSIIRRAFSSEVIKPGKTTNQDVVWWMRQQVNNLGLGTWFQTTVDVQRKGSGIPSNLAEDAPIVIQRGDVLHCDFGITALGLATDTQHMAYVLRAGETDAPAGIKKALANTNRMQDILMEKMKPGLTGNEVLADAIATMKAEKIKGTFYTHPIGDNGHGAGPLIGLWDRQEGVPGRGDVKLIPNTWFSIELGSRTSVPEWDGQELSVAQEEDAVLNAAGKMEWVLRRQTKYHLVR
ncbi:MAG: aminopeptidase P family protein [Acidobacteria bacterium]|nr:aminopeptidase P family protein [Acidobacteriota bacterium]